MPEFFTESGPEITVPAKELSACWNQSRNGSWGILLAFGLDRAASSTPDLCPERISSTIWITERSANMAHKQLKTLGVDSDSVDRAAFRSDPNPFLKDAECSLVIFEEAANDYHDEPKWIVKWINDPGSGTALPEGVDPLAILSGREKAAPKKKAENPAQAKLPGVPNASKPRYQAPSASATRAATASGPEPDDDVPF